MTFLCIHAHPDDAEILAGGTLALLANAGHQITIVTMTAGDCGSGEHGPDEISATRKAEAAASAALIGAEYLCAGFQDLAIFNDDSSRRKVTQILRQVRPQVVLTASPEDYLCDHEATSQLVRDACFGAALPNYRTESGAVALSEIPHLYFMDPIEMLDRAGNPVGWDFIVDVNLSFETKKSMLAKHESQRSWLKRQHKIDNYLSKMEEWTRACGVRAGVSFGEGFRQYRAHPYPQTPLLQEALASYVFRNGRTTVTQPQRAAISSTLFDSGLSEN
jgi:LmbE family N-acetylglucosaminyl deacetylase